MDPDPLQEAWQSQPEPVIDADRLVREFRRSDQQFNTMILWRDAREVGVSLLLLPVWIAMGVGIGLPWTWYLVMPGIVWIGGFMTVDRIILGRRKALPGESLVQGVKSSLAEVEHQIWMLRNVHWWYLLPPALGMLPFFGQVAWQARSGGWVAVLATSLVVAIVGIVFAVIYGVNQYAVRADLEPRRRELETLL